MRRIAARLGFSVTKAVAPSREKLVQASTAVCFLPSPALAHTKGTTM
jgi:hypothetical protein